MICRTWHGRCPMRAAAACLLRCLPSAPRPCRCLHSRASVSVLPPDAASPSLLSTVSSSPSPSAFSPAPSSSSLGLSRRPASKLSAAEQSERDRCVAVHLQRQQLLEAALRNSDGRHLRIAFDLSFARGASASACSLATQLSFVIACNKQAQHPACIFLTALDPELSGHKRQQAAESIIQERPEAADDVPQLEEGGRLKAERPFVYQMLKRGAKSWMVNCSSLPVNAIFRREECVYLSPDATQPLWRLSPHTVLVVGGIIDRAAVVKNTSLRAAEWLSLRALRLPIRECLPGGLRKTALNVDLVFALLLHVHQAAQIQRRQTVKHEHEPRATQQPPPSASSSSWPSPPLSQPLSAEADSGIDWHSLWCRAFDEVIPKRLRWSNEELSAKQNTQSRAAAGRQQPPQRRSALTAIR